MSERPASTDRSSGGGSDPGPGQPADTPPEAAVLGRLPRDDWDRIVDAVRDRLGDHPHPQAKRLRALPTDKLAAGRSRRDLCALLATDEELWQQVVDELAGDERGEDVLTRLRDGVVQTPAREPDRGARIDVLERRLSEAEQREDRLRGRNRELLAERDDAQRRAEGLEARLRTERSRAEELEGRIEELERERNELSGRLEEADAERASTVERLKRQHAAEAQRLREELRERRRREEERRRAEERRREAAREAEARAAEQVAAYRQDVPGSARAVRPGRPSRLPSGLDPAGPEAAAALFSGGRRVLIDGYNVTKQHRGRAPLEQQRRWLVGCCETLAADTGTRITVVFDGQEGVGRAPAGGRRVRVRFSVGRTADDELVDMVAGLPADEPVAVVTDDRELRERLADQGVDLVPTPAFVAVAE